MGRCIGILDIGFQYIDIVSITNKILIIPCILFRFNVNIKTNNEKSFRNVITCYTLEKRTVRSE